MKKKNITKIMTVMLAALLLASAVSYAGCEAEILFPENGSIIENVDKAVEVNSAGYEEIIFKLDGEIVGKDEYILKGSQLSLGKHNLTTYAVFSDGSVYESSSDFTVCKKKSEAVISANLNNPSTATLTESTVELGDNVNIIPQKNQTGYATVSIIDRAEGDKAVNLRSENGFSKPRPFTNIVFPKTVTSKIEIKHDIKLNNTDTRVWYELYTGEKAYWFNSVNLFEKGKVMGKSYEYDADTWYTIKMVFDFSKRVYSVFIGDDTIIENEPIEEKGVDMASCRITYECSKAGGGYSLDNVYINEIPEYLGISEIKYMYGEEESTDVKPDAKKLSAIKAYFGESVTDGDVSDLVSIVGEDGKEVKIASARGNSSDKCVTVTLDATLSANKEYTLYTDININDSEDTSGAKSAYKFKTATGEYDINSISLICGESEAVSLKQIENSSVKAKVDFANNGEENRKISILMTVREDDALVSISAKDIEIPGNKESIYFEIESALLEDISERADVQIMFLESISGRKPEFQIYNYSIK